MAVGLVVRRLDHRRRPCAQLATDAARRDGPDGRPPDAVPVGTRRRRALPLPGRTGHQPHERIQRGASIWLEDIRQRLNFEKAIGIDLKPRVPPAKTAAERQVEQRARMTEHGLDLKFPVKSTTELFGAHLKGAVKGNAEWVYRFLSAFAHGSSLMLTMSELGQQVETSAPGLKQVLVTSDSRWTQLATQLAVDGLARALDDLEAYIRGPQA